MNADLHKGTELFDSIRQSPDIVPWLQRMDAHDGELCRHSLLTGAIASAFCRSVRLTEYDARLFVTGAILHDVGKLSIPRDTLRKNAPLTAFERSEMERHPEIGAVLLRSEGWEPEVLELVHLHHERLDGSGYPQGLKREKIGRLVRMLMLCDVFSALIEDRSYRPSPRRPIEIMRAMASEFDESLLRAFSQDVPDFAYRALTLLKQEVPVASFAHS